MTPEAKGLVRAAAAAAAGIGLVLAGIAIGANLVPRAVTIERRIVERRTAAAADDAVLPRLPDMIETACAAVVAVKSAAADTAPAAPRKAGRHAGTSHVAGSRRAHGPAAEGIIISADGLVLTASANLPASGTLTVALNDGQALPAQRVRSDALTGLTLLKVDATDLPVLEFAREAFPRVGDVATAIASPAGSGCSQRFGLIGVDFLADAPAQSAYVRVDPTSSDMTAGTPLLDIEGRVVGIAGVWSEDPGAVMPAGLAQRAAAILLRGDAPAEERFGLLTDDLSPQLAARLGASRSRGAVVLIAKAGGPAGRSGLKAGDVILSAAGAPVSSASELGRLLDAQDGATPLTVLRAGDTVILKLRAAAAK